MAIEIPIQFRKREFRFVLLDKEAKRPIEKDWQTISNYEFDDSKLLRHLENGGNYGILMGRGRLICFDLDNPNLVSYYDEKFKDTLIVETGSKKRHYFFFSDFKTNKRINNVGEIRCERMQLVGANSIHPNKQPYKIINNNEIKEISDVELNELFKTIFSDGTTFVVKGMDDSMSGIEYHEIGKLLKEGKTKEEIFKHMENPIFEKWNTHGLKYPQYRELTFERAKEFLINTNQLPLTQQTQNNINNNYPFWTIVDYENYKPSKNYIIEELVYPEEIEMVYSQSGHFKSLDGLYRAVCIVSGKKYLGKFRVKKCAVGIISAENHKKIDKIRLKAIMRGLKIRKKNLPLYILPRENCRDILDMDFKLLIEDFICKKGIKVLFIDTINPVTPQVDDNKAKDVTRIYNEFFKPLVDKYKITICFFHHTDKKATSFLGSMKFRANSDVVYFIDRKGLELKYTIYNEKNREGEIGSLEVGVQFTNNKKETKEIKFFLLKQSEQKGIGTVKRKTKSQLFEEKINSFVSNKPISRGDLIKLCDSVGSVSVFDKALRGLVKQGQLIKSKEGYTKNENPI
ncbi:MAG: AAA family ATPase [Candidatus Pacearchaeota archaeon]